jgi:integrase
LFPFVLVGPDSGARRGELLASTWPDLNFETGELNVSKSLEQTKAGGLRIKGTKSGEPRRFPISEWGVEVLQAHRVE